MSNITLGNKTESTTVRILRNNGFWVYNCPKSNSGSQPFDIIALKGKPATVYLIDSKHVESGKVSFVFGRVEDNQSTSFRYASDFAELDINNMGFAIEFERTGEVLWLPYVKYLELSLTGCKSVNKDKLIKLEDKLNDK